MRILKNHWPIVVAVTALWVVVLILLRISIARNQGHVVYALDDSYIHIAIAKNLLHHGVWGITRNAFASATSSTLWPLLLTIVYAIFGVREIGPFILNVLFATAVLVFVHATLRQSPAGGAYRLMVLLAAIFLTPLPTLIFVGMEHTAQILFDLLFVFVAAELLALKGFAWRDRKALTLLALAPLVTSIRYEGAFLIFVVCVLLTLRRRVAYAAALGLLALLPIAVYGWISVKHGAYWLPNSLLLKVVLPVNSPKDFFHMLIWKAQVWPHVPLQMVLATTLYCFGSQRLQERWSRDWFLLTIFLGASALHFVLAGLGWFYRYEAYLVAIGILVNARLLRRAFPAWRAKPARRVFIAVAAGLLPVIFVATAFVLIARGISAMQQTETATTNIYEQQYQMASFVRDYYQGAGVMANDVGAINVLADINCVDLWGLANVDVARAKLDHKYNSTMVYEMGRAANARIAIVYDEWLGPYGGVPAQWTWVGEWRIPNNVICAFDRVSFYAVDPAEVPNLTANLTAFAARLPPDVAKKGLGMFPLYPLGSRVDLTQTDTYLGSGWSGNEPSIRWTEKNRAFIVFGLNDVQASSLRVRLTPFLVPGKLEAQHLNITLNDQPIASLVLKETGEYTIALPANALGKKNSIGLELPDARSPASLGVSADQRRLGVDVEWIEIKHATSQQSPVGTSR